MRYVLTMFLVASGLLLGCGGPPSTPGKCDLELTKSIDGDATPGGSATYTLGIENVGDENCAPPIVVEDSMPPGVTYQSTPTSGWNCQSTSSNPDEIECTSASMLAPGDTASLELQVQFTDQACMASNCAAISNGKPGQSANSPRIDDSPENNTDCETSECNTANRCVDPPSDMVGWWTADQTADDRSTESNHGTVQNGAHYTTGQVLEAFVFDGDDDRVEVPDDASLDFGPSQNFTVDGWVYPDRDRDVGFLIDKREKGSAGVTGWGLRWESGRLVVYLQTNGSASNQAYASAPQSVPRAEWTHFTVVVDRGADTADVYLDGALDGSFQPSATVSGGLGNGASMYFGRDFSGTSANYFKGRLDEIEIFDRVLTSAEIGGLVKAGACGKCRIPCREGRETYAGGAMDQFGGGSDPSTPSPYLQTFAPNKPFDDTAINRHFIHTFDNLKPTLAHRFICAASLEIRMQPGGSSLVSNDSIQLSFSDGAGNPLGPVWTRALGGPNGLSSTWNNSTGAQTFTLDIANLPTNSGTTSLLTDLDNFAMLNLRVQDDTTVDWANLTVRYCCDPATDERTPDLSVEKRHAGEFVVGQSGTYTISVENIGTGSALPTTTITDSVPSCMTIQGIAAPWDQWCSTSGNQVTCDYPDPIPPGSTLPDLEIEVVASADCSNRVENCAKVEHDDDTDSSNDESCDLSEVGEEGATADLGIRKRAKPTSFQRGSSASYQLDVFNNGPDAAPGPITVTDQLPSCLTYIGASPSTWSCATSGTTVTCTHPGPLASGQSLPLQIGVDVTDRCGDRIRNCARVDTASSTDSDTSNDEACIMTPVS